MDERVKGTYRQIYSELFSLILYGCCISLLVRILCFQQELSDCIPEFSIIVGSPVYLLIRSRMLGVTQADVLKSRSKRRRRLALVCSLFLSLMVFAALIKGSRQAVNPESLLLFAISFLTCFILTQLGLRKLEDRRQKKLDSQYE